MLTRRCRIFRVGQEVAKKLDALGMDIVAYDPYISEERADRLGAELVEFEDCLDAADFLTIHTPLTPETEGLIGADELDLLEGGYIVNVGRGGIIQEDALAAKVEDGTVAGSRTRSDNRRSVLTDRKHRNTAAVRTR